MNLRTKLQYTLATSIGFMFEGIFYGIYCVIFAAFVRTQLKTRRANNRSKTLLYLVTANFIACTAYVVVDVIARQSSVSNDSTVSSVSNILYSCINLTSQVILMHQCWILWRQPWVMVVPCVLTFAILVIPVTAIAVVLNSKPHAVFRLYHHPLVLSFFVLSLAENAIVTGLIITKILTTYRRGIQGRGLESHANGPGRDTVPVTSILIESGVITFMVQLVHVLMLKFDPIAFTIIDGLVAMLLGISTAIVLVRAEMGLTYDASKTVIRFAASSNNR